MANNLGAAPYQQALDDRGGRISTPWLKWFNQLQLFISSLFGLSAGYVKADGSGGFTTSASVPATDVLNYFASMYGDNVSLVVTVSASNTYYAVPTGLSAGAIGNTAFSFAASALTCLVPGTYLVTWTMSVNPTAGGSQQLEGSVMKNGAYAPGLSSHTTVAANTDTQHYGSSGTLSLAANDVVKLCVNNNSGTTNVQVDHAGISLIRIGP